ncbi:ferredoxin domain-containing protein [Thermohalobacter berrensis]|uniref:Ferredoxin n=1 Tax=Thermohalobacter berrensis TaxID=99594 RepID=A0A419SY04_9FIRM|nr:DUF2148 domain-containing protein [Thermohalobacter berrensis]RKD30039.1 ferredoxin [Thermohalobacter berrensis]
MIYRSDEAEKKALISTAEKMCVAARTAPKGKGIDNIVTAILTDNDKEKLAEKMEEIAERENVGFFARDAENVRQASVIVLIGTKLKSRGVPYCGFCGFENCEGKNQNGGICAFDVGDLGIAIGSAVSISANDRADNRIMFSAGKAAIELNLLGEDVEIVYGIPLSAKGKNIFFDRK